MCDRLLLQLQLQHVVAYYHISSCICIAGIRAHSSFRLASSSTRFFGLNSFILLRGCPKHVQWG